MRSPVRVVDFTAEEIPRMPFVDHYPHGAPCWFELGTTDQAAAKEFYTQLFGWSVFDAPMGPDRFYTMFKLKDRDVAAAYTLGPQMQGVPPHWNVYFAAPEVDETAAKVPELGGAIVQPPFDVMDVGRMAIAKDPEGAMFSLWQEKRHSGAGIMSEDNAVLWSELATRDTAKAAEFYKGLLGWETEGHAITRTYIVFSVGGVGRGGLLPMDDQWGDAPSHWGIYFMVADCDATAAKAKALGASVRYGPFDAPGVGRMASLADPQGAGFSILQPKHM
jgi:predicted enzyme related to lactoylglutathione lyase